MSDRFQDLADKIRDNAWGWTQEELDTAMDALRAAEELDFYGKEIVELRADYNKLRLDYGMVLERASREADLAVRLHAQRDALKEELAHSQRTIDGLQWHIDDKNSRLAVLEKELATLKGRLEEAEKQACEAELELVRAVTLHDPYEPNAGELLDAIHNALAKLRGSEGMR